MPLPSSLRTAAAPSVQETPDATLRVVTICSGNICRSPLLEQLLRMRLPAVLPAREVEVASAGTIAIDGAAMDAEAALEAERLGVQDAGAHRARRLRERHLADADLVLGLAREHRDAAASLVPRAQGRVFTAIELAALLRLLAEDGERFVTIAAVLDAAHRSRGTASVRGQDLDVVDPYRRGPAVHREAAEAIERAAGTIADALRTLLVERAARSTGRDAPYGFDQGTIR